MQQVWRKRWRSTAWFALAGLTLVLLISAVYKKNHKPCRGVEVTFSGDGNNFFIEEKGVIGLLKEHGLTIGQPIETINLKSLEETLKKDKWIANAELFFDNNEVLQVKVEEKTPVARIFTVEGSSFYIDSACRKLPLSEKLSARIPMFTNFPTDRASLSKPDSELLASIKNLAMFIQADDFWKAQVAQVDVTPDGFDMIPTIGNHIVVLGDGEEFQEKFDRLFSFYKQVWTKVGFEKYEKVDVRFDGQVVATLRGAKQAVVDSAKVRKAYETLVAETKKPADDAVPVLVAEKSEATGSEKKDGDPLKTDPGPKKSFQAKGSLVKTTKKETVKRRVLRHDKTARNTAKTKQVSRPAMSKQVADSRIPKAVMKARKRTEKIK